MEDGVILIGGDGSDAENISEMVKFHSVSLVLSGINILLNLTI